MVAHLWKKTGLIKMSSSDGKAAYIENIRDIDLFITAASSGGETAQVTIMERQISLSAE